MKNYGKLHRILMIAMLVMCGGKMWADNWPHTNTSVTTWDEEKTYYLYSSNEQFGSTGTYKFYVLETEEDPSSYDFTNATKYDAISPIIIDGGENSQANGSGIHVKIVFNTSKPVGFVGFFCINDGTLEMNLGQYYTNTNGITLKRTGGHSTYSNSNYNCPFTIPDNNGSNNNSGISFSYNGNEKNLDAQKIIITGNNPLANELVTYPNSGYVPTVETDTSTFLPTRQFVIDGGCVPTLTETGSGSTAGYNINYNDNDTKGRTTFFRVMCGTLQLTNVTLQNCSATAGNAGAIYVITNSGTERKSSVKVDLEHCWIHHCANGYPGIYIQYGITKYTGTATTPPTVTINRSKFTDCYSTNANKNAAIRSYSNGLCNLTMNKCTVWNNYGGGVRWQSTRPCTATFNNCLIKKNKAYGNSSSSDAAQGSGGGLLIKSSATINGCLIRDNWAQVSGGGIYYTAFEENAGNTVYEPEHGLLTFDMDPDLGTTVIEKNEAVNHGGGIAVMAQRMRARPYYYGYTNGELTGQYTMTFRLHGATVRNNTASTGNGGGVYISRAADASFYETTCNLDYGNIYNNEASNGYGGGVCVQSLIGDPGETPSGIYPKDIIVTTGVNGGSNSMQVYNNNAQKGAGIYVEAYPVTYNGTTSKVTTTLYDGTNINTNTATTDGGGLYVEQGLVTLQGSGNTNDPTISKNTTATSGNGGGVYLNNGNVNMASAIIGGSAETDRNQAGISGGGVYVQTGSVSMLSSTVSHNIANNGNGGGIYVNTGDVFINRTEQGGNTPSQITYNQAHNGGGIYNHAGSILAFGTVGTGEAGHVQISNNQATAGSGGGIYCTGDATTTSYDIRLRRVDIKNNTATANGGGIYLDQGLISIVNGVIDGNTASGNGGGVYTHAGNIDVNPTGDERNATRITNNTAAGNGGGLNTHSGLITVKGKDANQRIIVSGNKAGHGSNAKGSGGGVFCMGLDGNTEYITMRHVDLINNRANGDGTEVSNVTTGCGGGMYLQQGRIGVTDVKIQNNLAQYNGGGINNHSGSIDVDGCIVGGSQYYNSSYSINASGEVSGTAGGNKADNSGGGIYTRLGDIDIEDYVETSGNITRIESKVTYNEAAKNGGGIDTRQGTIYINRKEMDDQIEVAFNKAERGGGLYANAGTIVTYNAQIHDNTATLHGGGANNHSGNIILYGGSLSNNTAKEGHGGGAYTNVGDIDLFQFPSTELQNPTLNHGTKVYNNIAKLNGGAFNNHTGRVDVRHATIYNNTSTLGNGGAIYCEGPHANVDRGLGYTIRLLCSDMVQNKTRGQDGTETAPTGRGGGIYLKYGSIYAHYSNIRDNEANIAGGGLNNHEGNILLYGCDITGNRALELDGGGIFIKSGSITTGPSTVREASPTSAKATIVQNNTAYRNGGGIINLDGNITLNGDLIGGATSNLGNKALTGNGGGVYIANGIINMKGGQIDNNTAENGKGGGVYSGGGEFNIGEREENPKPIVLLVDTEVKRVTEGQTEGQTATIHYHLVDQGKYDNVTDVQHGIIWGITEDPTTEVIYDSQAGTTNGYTYTQGEPACQRITIPASRLDAETTYYAKAFFRYKTGDNVIRGYSETLKFVTFSNSQPLVISGSVSNITKNSAQGSGRVMDNGGYNITERGVEIRRDKIGDETTAPAPIKIPASETTEFFTVSNLRDPSYPTDNVSLIPNTTYYAKAYATNSNGQTGYGNEVEFTTLKDTPDMGNGLVTVSTSINENNVIVATASFTMPSGTTFGNGTNDVKAYGFIWSRDDDPELSTDHTVPGTLTQGTTTFTATYTGVTPGITFYVRAYASTIESGVTPNTDITNYSLSAATQCFSPMLDDSPVVRAIEISGITQNSATITCQIYSGYQAGTKYGIYVDNLTNTTTSIPQTGTHYFPSTNATPANEAPNTDPYPYTYTVQLTGLNPGTTYYLKAYGTNATSPSYATENPTVFNYGNGYNFTALPVMQPNVVITSVSNIQKTSATINCSVEDGGGNITAYGVKWGTSASALDQSIEYNNTQTGYTAPNGSFTQTISSLTAHTTYYVQAYATNSAGTHTCQAVSFTTDYDHPSVAFTTTNPISEVGFSILGENSYQYSAKGTYTVTPITSGEAVKTHGVCWSIFRNPTRRISAVSDSHYAETTETEGITTSTPCNQTFHPAYPNTKYYVHAYVSTSMPDTNGELADIVYDPADPNITFVSLPIVLTGGATAITNSSASLTVNINSPDREHHLRKYGVCWTDGTETPTKTAGHFVEGDITAANPTGVSYNLTANVGGTAGTTKTYRYRAYCINENSDAQGNIAYGDIKEFTTTAYTITATALPATAGTVSGGGGFNANASCTLTASEPTSNDYTFQGWYAQNGTTALTPDRSFTFSVNESAAYEARYNSKVTLTAGEGGQVSFDNTNYAASASGFYAYNASITVYAQASSNYTFVNWTDANGNEVSTSATYTFNVTDAISLTANFVSNRRSTSMNTSPRPRDIYPAPAREPWDWDDDLLDCHAPLAMTETTDTIVPTRGTTTAPVNKPSINNNSAEYGGGVYVEHNEDKPAKIVFAGGGDNEHVGTINNNTATEAGGGVYISQGAAMQMKGHCQVNNNHVPSGKKGGGIYLDGILNVGDLPTDQQSDHALQVTGNWVGGNSNPGTPASRNNVFLPTDAIVTTETVGSETVRKTQRVVTLLSDISGKDGNNQFYTNIGISVEHGFREVIFSPKDYTSSPTREWLNKLMPAGGNGVLQSALFDDSQNYYALHVHPSDGVFDDDYIYFWSCWTTIVNLDPERTETGQPEHHHSPTNEHYYVDNEGVWHIKSREGLAWFSSWVNGLNYNEDTEMPHKQAHPTAKAVIENDLDMSAYFWVPLGSVTGVSGTGQSISFTDGGSYQGTFDGQGHIIKGLICTYMTGIFKYGLFGTVGDNGVVKNTFVDDYRFTTYKQKQKISSNPDVYQDYNPTYYMGGIAAQVTGSGIIKNCEARGEMKTPLCDAENTCVGGLVGLINSTTGTEVHSSMAMPEIVGTTIGSTINPFTAKNVGGLVGKINANNMLKNSFANVKLGTIANTVNVGGLVGNNLGTVENCYARLQGYDPNKASTVPSNFGWFAGTNAGSISYCYAPRVANDGSNNYSSFSYVKATSGTPSLTGQDNYGLTERVSGKYGFKHRDHQMRFANNTYELALAGKASANDTLIGGLQFTLNRWVNATNGNTSKYSTWTRTMASPINDDYPILEFADFNAVGSEDSIYMLYNTDVNPMITAFNAVDATKHPTPSIYLYDANPTTLNVSNDDNVMLAINEDIGIKQTVPLKARVGVTIKNKANADAPNWHLFSSSINGVPMGIRYRTAEDETSMNIEGYGNGTYKALIVDKAAPSGQTDPYHPESVWGNRAYFDPPTIEWYQSDNVSQTATYDPDKVGYFPTNTPYGTWRSTPSTEFFDLYAYSEEFYHWVNFKREGSSTISDHWHMDRDEESNHWRLNYGYRDENGTFTLGNEPTLLNGKGYLLDLSSESMMMADGTLNTGNVSTWTTNTPVGTHSPTGNGYDAPWREINLIGNPYQSFLDFDLFAQANMPDGSGTDAWKNVFYATRDDNSTTSRNGYIYYVPTQSENKPEYTASRYIHPHQGFFVKVTGDGALTFKDNMRVAGTSNSLNSPYRDRLNYPLVNLLCYDDNGDCDLTIVEVNRPEFGGGQKMKKLHSSNGMIYARLEDRDFQVLFTPMGTNTVPVRFEAAENGHFTLRWNTLHGDFSYLHLIDNITGMDIDCLTTDEYKFEGKTTDYKSRFKLVFDCTGIDEPEDPEPDDGSTVFAFQMGNELIVNGEGMLQLFDLNGRCLMTKQAVGQQSNVSLPQVAAGMYLLRLTSNKQVRVQKMIIK